MGKIKVRNSNTNVTVYIYLLVLFYEIILMLYFSIDIHMPDMESSVLLSI